MTVQGEDSLVIETCLYHEELHASSQLDEARQSLMSHRQVLQRYLALYSVQDGGHQEAGRGHFCVILPWVRHAALSHDQTRLRGSGVLYRYMCHRFGLDQPPLACAVKAATLAIPLKPSDYFDHRLESDTRWTHIFVHRLSRKTRAPRYKGLPALAYQSRARQDPLLWCRQQMSKQLPC